MTIDSFNRVVQGFHYTTLSYLLATLNGVLKFEENDSRPTITPPGLTDSCVVDKVEPDKFNIVKDCDGNPVVYVTFHRITRPEKIVTSFGVLSLTDQIHIVNCVLLKLNKSTKNH